MLHLGGDFGNSNLCSGQLVSPKKYRKIGCQRETSGISSIFKQLKLQKSPPSNNTGGMGGVGGLVYWRGGGGVVGVGIGSHESGVCVGG